MSICRYTTVQLSRQNPGEADTKSGIQRAHATLCPLFCMKQIQDHSSKQQLQHQQHQQHIRRCTHLDHAADSVSPSSANPNDLPPVHARQTSKTTTKPRSCVVKCIHRSTHRKNVVYHTDRPEKRQKNMHKGNANKPHAGFITPVPRQGGM